jgi:hypothetical protein
MVNELSMLLIEQNVSLALDICKRGYVMERRQIVLEGTSAELKRDKRVIASYLGIQDERSGKCKPMGKLGKLDSEIPGALARVRRLAPKGRRVDWFVCHERLRQSILKGVYPPGTKLVERSLCRELNVTPFDLRAALHDPAADGLISLVPGEGASIDSIKPEDAAAVLAARGVAAHLAARAHHRSANLGAGRPVGHRTCGPGARRFDPAGDFRYSQAHRGGNVERRGLG